MTKIETNKQKSNKTQNTKLNKKGTKRYGVDLVLANYFWAWVLPYSVFDIRSDFPLEKTNFQFLIMYQRKIASWLRVGLCIQFSVLRFCLA